MKIPEMKHKRLIEMLEDIEREGNKSMWIGLLIGIVGSCLVYFGLTIHNICSLAIGIVSMYVSIISFIDQRYWNLEEYICKNLELRNFSRSKRRN